MLILFKAAENENEVLTWSTTGNSSKKLELLGSMQRQKRSHQQAMFASIICFEHTYKYKHGKMLSVDWILWSMVGLCRKKNYNLCMHILHQKCLPFSQRFTVIAKVII